jgi:hypothetical protein
MDFGLSKCVATRLLLKNKITAKAAAVQNSTTLTRIAYKQDCTRCVAVGRYEQACGAETLLAVEPANQDNAQVNVSVELPKSPLLQDKATLTCLSH